MMIKLDITPPCMFAACLRSYSIAVVSDNRKDDAKFLTTEFNSPSSLKRDLRIPDKGF